MIRRLRTRHRWMIVIVALACLVLSTVALLARTPARPIAVPPTLQLGDPAP
ncbi:MAG: hypothetical protein SGJ01_15125 [Gemmatimonadota bacterium]|nr:hypothetical protein [Gemmatimonadota bacterium]